MPRFERMEFPKKYAIPNGIKFGILALVFVGIWIQTCSDRLLHQQITITNVRITDYSKVHVEVQYDISNLSKVDREVKLLLKIYDHQGQELGSSLFQVSIAAGKTQSMIKIIDKLSRALNEGEKPYKTTLSLYTKKVI